MPHYLVSIQSSCKVYLAGRRWLGNTLIGVRAPCYAEVFIITDIRMTTAALSDLYY